MKIKYQSVLENFTPIYMSAGAVGADLSAVSVKYDEINKFIEYDTGVSIEIPKGYAGFIVPRSSNTRYPLIMNNSPGIIDQDYRGTIKVRFKILLPQEYDLVNPQNNGVLEVYKWKKVSWIKRLFGTPKWDNNHILDVPIYSVNTSGRSSVGDEFIAQLMIIPVEKVTFDNKPLSETKRGNGGFGSTTKKKKVEEKKKTTKKKKEEPKAEKKIVALNVNKSKIDIDNVDLNDYVGLNEPPLDI